MKKSTTETIICEHYRWRLIQRDGVYYADGRCNSPAMGKHSLGTRILSQAIETLKSLDKRLAGKADPETHLTVETGPIPITEGWERYRRYCCRPSAMGGVSLSTQKRYRAVRDHHVQFCAARRIEDWRQVDKRSLNAFGEYLASKGRADATICLSCNTVIQVLNWMIREEKILDEKHRVRLKLFCSEESHTYCYTRDEVAAMLQICSSQKLEQLGLIILILSTTGMRIGELLQLRWGDVDMVNNFIHICDNRHDARSKQAGTVRTTKGKRGRRVPIHERLRQKFLTIEKDAAARVIVGKYGGEPKADRIRTAIICEILKPLQHKFPAPEGQTGVIDGRLHSFRHFFVSQAFISGVSEGEIREWVGHKDSRMIERYRHLQGDDAQRKMNQICFFNSPADTQLQANVDAKQDETIVLATPAESGVPASGVALTDGDDATHPGVTMHDESR